MGDAGQILQRLLPACHNGSVKHVNGQSDGQRSLSVDLSLTTYHTVAHTTPVTVLTSLKNRLKRPKIALTAP